MYGSKHQILIRQTLAALNPVSGLVHVGLWTVLVTEEFEGGQGDPLPQRTMYLRGRSLVLWPLRFIPSSFR